MGDKIDFLCCFFFLFHCLIINVIDRRKRTEGKIVRVIKLYFLKNEIGSEIRIFFNIWILLQQHISRIYNYLFNELCVAFDLEELTFRQR